MEFDLKMSFLTIIYRPALYFFFKKRHPCKTKQKCSDIFKCSCCQICWENVCQRNNGKGINIPPPLPILSLDLPSGHCMHTKNVQECFSCNEKLFKLCNYKNTSWIQICLCNEGGHVI